MANAMKKGSIKQEYQYDELSPFQDIKIVFSSMGPALRRMTWRPVIVNAVVAYIIAFVVLLAAYRLLEGAWILIKVIPMAALVAGLIAFNMTLQGVFPYIRARHRFESAKLKRSMAKDERRKSG